jgi:phospholipase/carboxylesterase
VVILLHGRGGTAEDILSLAPEMGFPELSFLAPQAARNSWYPNSFLAPIGQNEPWLSSALDKVGAVLAMVQDAGIPAERVVIAGFSQGACLSTEFVARNPRRYAALVALTGGLIGPLDSDLKHAGDLSGTPALICSGDPDSHVPWARVQESARILGEMGAVVTLRKFEGRPHTVSREELELARGLIADAFRTGNR